MKLHAFLECLIETAGDALKWTSHLKHYFLNNGLTKNYDTTVSLESNLQEVTSSSALTTKQTTYHPILKNILIIL